MRDRLQDLLREGVLVEPERQHDGRRPLFEPQLDAHAGRGHVQVQVIGVKDHGAVQRVDQQALRRGGGPAASW